MIIKFIDCNSIECNINVEIYNNESYYYFRNVKNELNIRIKKDVYHLKIYYKKYIFKYIFIYQDDKTICIKFNNQIRKKFIYLTDYHYKNLKIKRGEIIIWQKI